MFDDFNVPSDLTDLLPNTGSNATGGGNSGGGFDLVGLIKALMPVGAAYTANKIASPSGNSGQTGAQNAAAYANLPPEVKTLIEIQLRELMAKQPVKDSILAARVSRLPAQYRPGFTPSAAPMSVPSLDSGIPNSSSQASIIKNGGIPGGGADAGTKPGPYGGVEGSPFYGAAGAEGTGSDHFQLSALLAALLAGSGAGMVSPLLKTLRSSDRSGSNGDSK